MEKNKFYFVAYLFFIVSNYFSQLQCRVDSMYYYYSSDFQLSSKAYYTYNQLGQLINLVYKVRDNNDTALWVNSTPQFVYTYNVSGDTLTELKQEWNSTTNAWNNSTIDTFKYDSMGKLTSKTKYLYDNNNMTWYNGIFKKVTYTYNAFGQLSYMLVEKDNVGSPI